MCTSENGPISAIPKNLPFFKDEIYQIFSYSYVSKVPKWKCAHILLCKKYKNCLKLLSIAYLQALTPGRVKKMTLYFFIKDIVWTFPAQLVNLWIFLTFIWLSTQDFNFDICVGVGAGCCTTLLQLVCNLTSPHTATPRHASSLLSGPVSAHHQAGGVRLHNQFICGVQLWIVTE